MPSWDRTEAGLPIVKDVLKRLEGELGRPLPATWFIRADEAIRRQFGTYDAVFRRFDAALREPFAQGHEAGWLVGFSSCGPQFGLPGTELQPVLSELVEQGWRLRSARAGELQHDNASMAALDSLGIAFDSSALPRRRRLEDGWGIDWEGTPQRPYRPSLADYRIPGEPERAIWELPLTTVPMLAPYDVRALPRYLNPCMHGSYLWPALEAIVRDASYLLCILHPDEAIARTDGGHPLIAYSAEVLAENLRGIVRACAACGRAVSFKTVADFGAGLRTES